MFYIRKLSKKANLFKIKTADCIDKIDADVLRQEFGTTQNTLSFWKCEDLNSCKDTIKAILLSTTSISTSQFIIFDDKLLDKYKIDIDFEEIGMTAYKGFENLHVNLCNLTYEKIGYLLSMVKDIADIKERTPELQKQSVKNYISEVIEAGLINTDNIQESLLKDIRRYFPN